MTTEPGRDALAELPPDRRDALVRMTMADASIPGATVHEYRMTPTRSLRMHVIDGRVGRPGATEPSGAVALFHGGGWTIGSPMFLAGHARALADLGLVVALPEYRVRVRDETGIAQGLEDVTAAVDWMVDHVGDLGGDPARLALAGSSAGAHLVLLAAFARPDAGRCVIGWSTPCDLADVPRGAELTDEERARLSPVTHAADLPLPPTLLLHGKQDPIVPVDGCRRFVAAAHSEGRDVELVEFAGAGHGFEAPRLDGGAMLRRTLDLVVPLMERTGVLQRPGS